MKKIPLFLLAAGIVLLSGCVSGTKKFKKRLIGTWKIEKFTAELIPTGTSARLSINNSNNSPSGTVTLNEDLTGTINVTFTLKTPAPLVYNVTGPVTWLNDASSFTSTHEGVATTWAVGTNEDKKQVWTYTGSNNQVSDDDGDLNIKEIELSKP